MPRLLPLFPLQMVAFPGSAIPLHIFEERYREMVGDAAAAGTEFGIVLAKDGGVVNAGCTVIVESVLERYPDGRFDVMTRGRRRFSLVSVNEDKAYLRGEVEFFDDEDGTAPSAELQQRALRAFGNIRETLAEGGQPTEDGHLDPRDPLLGFHLARHIEDLDFQNLVLRTRSETERLEQFIAISEKYAQKKLYVEKMKRLGPTNGFGHKHDSTQGA